MQLLRTFHFLIRTNSGVYRLFYCPRNSKSFKNTTELQNPPRLCNTDSMDLQVLPGHLCTHNGCLWQHCCPVSIPSPKNRPSTESNIVLTTYNERFLLPIFLSNLAVLTSIVYEWRQLHAETLTSISYYRYQAGKSAYFFILLVLLFVPALKNAGFLATIWKFVIFV